MELEKKLIFRNLEIYRSNRSALDFEKNQSVTISFHNVFLHVRRGEQNEKNCLFIL